MGFMIRLLSDWLWWCVLTFVERPHSLLADGLGDAVPCPPVPRAAGRLGLEPHLERRVKYNVECVVIQCRWSVSVQLSAELAGPDWESLTSTGSRSQSWVTSRSHVVPEPADSRLERLDTPASVKILSTWHTRQCQDTHLTHQPMSRYILSTWHTSPCQDTLHMTHQTVSRYPPSLSSSTQTLLRILHCTESIAENSRETRHWTGSRATRLDRQFHCLVWHSPAGDHNSHLSEYQSITTQTSGSNHQDCLSTNGAAIGLSQRYEYHQVCAFTLICSLYSPYSPYLSSPVSRQMLQMSVRCPRNVMFAVYIDAVWCEMWDVCPLWSDQWLVGASGEGTVDRPDWGHPLPAY